MKLTVIGNCGPYPGKDRATSGYLLEVDGKKVLIDCGSAVVSKLQNFCDIKGISIVILSHLHYDHAGDIMVLAYALEGTKKRGAQIGKLKVFLPGQSSEEYEKIASRELFDAVKVTNERKIELEGFTVEFAKTDHPIESYAIKITYKNKTFVFSGDATAKDFPIEFVKNADLFLCDAGTLERDKKNGKVTHLSPKEAGNFAKQAGVKRLLLTHFWPTDDTNLHYEEAKLEYPGVEISEAGKSYEI